MLGRIRALAVPPALEGDCARDRKLLGRLSEKTNFTGKSGANARVGNDFISSPDKLLRYEIPNELGWAENLNPFELFQG